MKLLAVNARFQLWVRLALVAIAGLFVCAPSARADAMICYQIKTERGRLQQETTKFGYDYMGTLATMGLCAASCAEQPKDSQAGCVIAACGTACAFIGMNYCVEAFSKMSAFSEREQELNRIAASYGCPQR